MRTDKQLIAFFSMEIALDPAMPTYSGGTARAGVVGRTRAAGGAQQPRSCANVGQ
jgi:hypothetical protein